MCGTRPSRAPTFVTSERIAFEPPPSWVRLLNEPANHLDVDSIKAVEAGLRAYDGALLVVSHDETFLKAIGITRRVEL